jgi:integrase
MLKHYTCAGCMELEMDLETPAASAEAWGRWGAAAAALETAARSAGTDTTYETGVNSFTRFCGSELGLSGEVVEPWAHRGGWGKAPAETLVRLWVGWMWREKHHAPSTVRNYVSHVKARCKDNGAGRSSEDWAAVARAVKGYARVCADEGRGEPRQAVALTEADARWWAERMRTRGVERAKGGPWEDAHYGQSALMIGLGFCGLLRRSEIVALRSDDVTMEGGVVRVRIVKSKNDQERRGAVVVVDAHALGMDWASLLAGQKRWLASKGLGGGAKLFCSRNDGGRCMREVRKWPQWCSA